MANPVVTTKVDWTLAGTFAAGSCDISAYVMAIEITDGENSDFGSGGYSGSATVTVKNSDGRFYPHNAAGAYYGNLKPGRPIWITCVYSAVTYGLFAGYIDRIIPDPEAKTAQIVCVDALSTYDGPSISIVAVDRSARVLRGAILDAVGEAAGRRDLAIEDEMISASSASGNAIAALTDLNMATLTRQFVRAGTAEPNWYYYTTRDRNYKIDAAADESVTGTLHISGTSGWDVSFDTLRNRQAVNFADGTSRQKTNSTSVTAYGVTRPGQDISSPYLQTIALADGVIGHIVNFRYADPRERPVADLTNTANIFPTVLRRNLYDVVLVTVTAMSATNVRMEIIGRSFAISASDGWRVSWRLQECPEQGSPPTPAWFTLDTDVLDGTARLGY